MLRAVRLRHVGVSMVMTCDRSINSEFGFSLIEGYTSAPGESHRRQTRFGGSKGNVI
jgi:hypothetical protein